MGRGAIPRFERISRISTRIVLGALAIVTVVLTVSWVLVSRPPSWWGQAPNATPAGAEAVERAISAELSRPHDPDEPWSIDLTEDAANAWLRFRLPKWLDHEGIRVPWPADRTRVRFGASGIRVGVDRGDHHTPRIVGVTVRISCDDASRISIEVRSAHLGGMTVGRSIAAALIGRALGDDSSDTAREILVKGHPFESRHMRFEGNRRVRIVGITPVDGRVRVTFRTVDGAGG